jgi:hypothetical protein
MTIDLNDAGEQRTFDVIPANTTATLQMTVRSGGAGDGGWLKRSADGASEGLDCEFLVVDEGPYYKRKLWQLFTLSGTTPGHQQAGEISRNTLRAILESARGIRPDDISDTAKEARRITGWGDLDGLRFVARLGVRPAQGNYGPKNTILEIVTPERQAWRKPEQLDRSTMSRAPSPSTTAPAPAGSIARPQWAG